MGKKAKRVASWGDIDPKVIKTFENKVEALREEMIPRNCDNDSPVTVTVTNRMTHEPFPFEPVPDNGVYSYILHGYVKVHPDRQAKLDRESERVLLMNLYSAQQMLERYFRQKHYREDKERVKQLPLEERIKEACSYCDTGVKLKPLSPDDFFFKKYGADWPSPWHVNDRSCDATELRRQLFKKKNGIADTLTPEPRWCRNPNCRAKLLDYDTKRGAKDKDACAVCKKDNG